MTTTFAHVPIEDLHPHPLNIRHDAVADDEMVESVRALGVLQAPVVAPAVDGDGMTVIGGHRRLNAAQRVGLKTIGCTIRDDLVTEAQQLEAMLVENGRRRDLTAVEEAEGYEQLELFGYKPKDIAKATGRSAATVRSRLKLAKLPEKARAALHDGQMTLHDAELLTEFSEDPEQMAELEEFVGTSNFRYRVERARDEREARQRIRAMVLDFEKQGATRTDWPGVFNTDTGPCPLRSTSVPEPAVHADAGCLGWTHSGSVYRDPELVCIVPGLHPQPETADEDDAEAARAERDAQWEAQRAEREARVAAERAAARVRIEHLVTHFLGLLTAKQFPKQLVESLRLTLPLALRSEGGFDSTDYMIAAGLSEGRWWDIGEAHAAGVAAGSPAGVLKAYAALQAAQVEYLLCDPGEEAAAQAWTWLVGTGFQLSDIDTALRDEAMSDQEGAA